MSEFAGALRTRVSHLRRNAGRDALGGDEQSWAVLSIVPAEVRPEHAGAAFLAGAASGLPAWRVTARPFALAIGDRLQWDEVTMEVRFVRTDPRQPDRIVATGEEV